MQTLFIHVILPLRLDWEPLYSLEYDDDSTCPVIVGSRVRVLFAAKEYCGVVSGTDAYEDARKVGFSKIHRIEGLASGLEPVSVTEIELWRKVSSYYLCTVGEVFKAAYPSLKIAEEETRARLSAERVERNRKAHEEERLKIEKRIARLESRLAAREDALRKARKDSVVSRLSEERNSILSELDSARAALRDASVQTDGVDSESIDEAASGAACNGTISVPELSSAQQKAFSEISTLMTTGKPVLLHGVTGSGKTEIYLKLASDTLSSGRNVLFLVPEIALSRQLEERIENSFPAQLKVFHSAETVLHRYETAEFIRRNPYVVLGTRSAIFLPHRDLGLVIVDEEHDSSYKQDSPAPRYNGRETAIMLASCFNASVILGSATPSLESLYNCSAGRYGLVSLKNRYYDAADSDVEVIDTIAERRKRGMVGSFSRKLIGHIDDCLSLRRQVLVLRERRAYSSAVQCNECGEIMKCRCCNVPLSLHNRQDGTQHLLCHYCGRSYEYSGTCAKCGGTLSPLGAGTQKIEEELRALFPEARVERLDGDSARDKRYSSSVIKDFSNGDIDILVGTQLIAKGFDFSGLTLVAVLQADSILGQEDYRADERGLQLLEQFRGRCGRRGEKGLFVIQTSQPEHPVYKTLNGEMDTSGMLSRFLLERKVFGYPPYSRVVGVILKDYNLQRIEYMASELGNAVRRCGMTFAAKVTGPCQPAVDKVSGQYIRWLRVLLAKDKDLAANKQILSSAVAVFEKERKYAGHIYLDVDPV